MANTITNRTLFEGRNKLIIQYTLIGDGVTAETDTIVVNKSDLTGPDKDVEPSKLSLMDIVWNISGSSFATLEWDRDTDVLIGKFANEGEYNYSSVGGKHDTGTGGTGDVVITTTIPASGEVMDFILSFKKKQ